MEKKQERLNIDAEGVKHKMTFVFYFLLSLLSIISTSVYAQKSAYAVYNNKTLTFYYDQKKNSKTGTKFDLNEGDNIPKWDWDIHNSITKVIFDKSFKDARPTSCYCWFSGFISLKEIEGIRYLNTSNVTTMECMFKNCNSLTSLDPSFFNTENVTNMSEMFNGCSRLTSLNVSKFNTSNVTNMYKMFAYCANLTSLDLSYFNTENVISMASMFKSCKSLTSLNVTKLNTGQVTDMYEMFYECGGLTTIDVSHFNTENVTSMGFMFGECTGLSTLDVTNFNTNNVTDMWFMFRNCGSLTSLDVSHFNTEKVTRMDGMFKLCSGLTTLDLSNFNTGNVRTMSDMFQGCSSLTSLDVTQFNTSKVHDMSGMFSICSSLTTLDITNFNTENVSSAFGMFLECSALTTIDLSKFITEKITDTQQMFLKCTSLTTILVSDTWNIDKANGYYMFQSNPELIGDKGTTFKQKGTQGLSYAHIDEGESNPGYLTSGKYKIFYNGIDDNDETLDSYTGAISEFYNEQVLLVTPQKEGYSFVGWTGSSITGLTEPTKNVVIAKGEVGNRIYTAHWQVDQHTVTLPAHFEFISANIDGKFDKNYIVQFKISNGYTLTSAAVTANIPDVEVTRNNDGTYSFTMPASNVVIQGTAKKTVILTVELDGWRYGDIPNTPIVKKDGVVQNLADITLSYTDEYNHSVAISNTTQVGHYILTATYPGNDDELEATGTTDFIISQYSMSKADLSSMQRPTANLLTYNGTSQPLLTTPQGTIPTGYTIQYKLSTGNTFTTAIPTAKNAGQYTVNVKYVGDINHTDFDGNNINVTIGKAPLFVEAIENTKVYGAPDPALLYYIGNLQGDDTQSSVLTGELSRVAGEKIGTYTILKNNLLANNNYELIFITADFTITKASIEKSDLNSTQMPTVKELVYNGYAQTLLSEPTEVCPDGYTIQYKLSSSTTFGTSIPTAKDAGTYTVNVKYVGDANHNDFIFDINATINKATLTVNADNKSKVYGSSDPMLTYIVSGLKGYDTQSGVLIGVLSRVSGEDIGTYTIKQNTLSANNNYELVFHSANFTITKESILNSDLSSAQKPIAKSIVYNGNNQTLLTAPQGILPSGYTIKYKLSTSSSFSTTIPSAKNAGTYIINVKYVGDANHNDLIIDVTATIDPALLTITVDSKSKEYGTNDPVLTYSVSGLKGADTKSTVLIGALKRAQGENIGIYTIKQNTLACNDNYTIEFIEANLTITKASTEKNNLTSTQKPTAMTLPYNGSAQPLLAAPAGTMPSGYTIQYKLSNASFYSATIPTAKNAGTYTVNVKYVGDANHIDFAGDDINATITKATLDITAANKTKEYGKTDPALTYTVNGLKGSDTESGVLNGTLSRTQGENVGTYTITQNNLTCNGNYTITYKGAIFSITKASSITKSDLSSAQKPAANVLTYNGYAQTLLTAPSGTLPTGYSIQYKLSTAKTFETTIPTAKNAGTYTVNVKYVGDNNHNDLTGNDINVTINKATLTVTATNKTKVYGSSDPELTYIVSGLQGTDTEYDILSGTLSRTIGENVGTYAIKQNTISANDNYNVAFIGANMEITPFVITSDDPKLSITATPNSFVYDGYAKEPYVKVEYNNLLISSSEYNVSYDNNVNPGKAIAVITDNVGGNYTVNGNVYFTILPVFTVTFHTDHGTAPAPLNNIIIGSKIVPPTNEMIADGYTFSGEWYIDKDFKNKWDFNNNIVNSDMTLYAYWTYDKILISSTNTEKNGAIIADASNEYFCNKKAIINFTVQNGMPQNYLIKFEDKSIPAQNGAITNNHIEIDLPQKILTPGTYNGYLELTNDDGKSSGELPFKIIIKLPFCSIVTLYNDIAAVNSLAGKFTDYQWTENSHIIGGAKGRLLRYNFDKSAVYTAILTSEDGSKLETCPLDMSRITVSKNTVLSVYPNPALPFNDVTIEILENYIPETGNRIYIYNTNGTLVKQINSTDKVNKVQLPTGNYSGIYIQNGDKVSFKLIVK